MPFPDGALVVDYAEREEHVQLAARLVDVLGPSDPRGLPARVAAQLDWLENANRHDPGTQDLAAMLSALLDELERRARVDREAWLTLTRIIRATYESEIAPSSSSAVGGKLAHLSHRLFVAEDLPQPSRAPGGPSGAGSISAAVSEVGLAGLVDVVAGQLRRNGYEPPLYTTDTNLTRPGLTVVGLVSEALHDRGISISYADVVRIYEDSWSPSEA